MNEEMILTPISPSKLISSIVEQLKKELGQHLLKKETVKENNEGEFFNTKEACEYLKCSTVKLWRLRKDGIIPFKKCGRTILIKKEDLKEYLSSSSILKKHPINNLKN